MTKLEEARTVYEAGWRAGIGGTFDFSRSALAIDVLIGKAIAEKEAAAEEALEREREIGRNNAQAWQSTVTRMEMALAENRQEQLDSDKRWKERLKAERLRSEQAAVLERKNWEAYREGEAERTKSAVSEALADARKLYEQQLQRVKDRYISTDCHETALKLQQALLDESEAERIGKAVQEAYAGLTEVFEQEVAQASQWGEKHRQSAINWCLLVIRHGINYRFELSLHQGVAPWVEIA